MFGTRSGIRVHQQTSTEQCASTVIIFYERSTTAVDVESTTASSRLEGAIPDRPQNTTIFLSGFPIARRQSHGSVGGSGAAGHRETTTNGHETCPECGAATGMAAPLAVCNDPSWLHHSPSVTILPRSIVSLLSCQSLGNTLVFQPRIRETTRTQQTPI